MWPSECKDDVIQATEILIKIQEGMPAEYNQVVIVGNLSLDHIEKNLCIVTSLIKIKDSKIRGTTNFENIIFQEPVDFENTVFEGPASFNKSQFNNEAIFKHSQFMDSADFESSQFKGFAQFDKAQFEKLVDFSRSRFFKDAFFSESQFNDSAKFIRSIFVEDVDFGKTKFRGEILFIGTKFKGNADFIESLFEKCANLVGSEFNQNAEINCQFNERVIFSNCQFNGSSRFIGSCFKENAVFTNSRFKNDTDFSETKFSKIANFNDAKFERAISFNNSQFEEDALFLNATFSGTLYLIRTKYDKLYIRWENIGKFFYDDAAYQLLVENFKKLGFFEDANRCFFQWNKDYRYRSGCSIYTAGWNWLMEKLYGYGVEPRNSLISSFFLIVFFGIIWDLIEKKKGRALDSNDNQNRKRISPQSSVLVKKLNHFVFSAKVFLSGTRLFIDPPKRDRLLGKWDNFAGFIYILERFVGALLFFLFVVAATNTLIRL